MPGHSNKIYLVIALFSAAGALRIHGPADTTTTTTQELAIENLVGPGWCQNGRVVGNTYCMNSNCGDVGTKNGCGIGPMSQGICCVQNIMDTVCQTAHHTSCSLPARAFTASTEKDKKDKKSKKNKNGKDETDKKSKKKEKTDDEADEDKKQKKSGDKDDKKKEKKHHDDDDDEDAPKKHNGKKNSKLLELAPQTTTPFLVPGPNWCRNGQVIWGQYCMSNSCNDTGTKQTCGTGPGSDGVCCVMNIMDKVCASAYHISCVLPDRAYLTTTEQPIELLAEKSAETRETTTKALVPGPQWCQNGRIVVGLYCMSNQCTDTGTKTTCGTGAGAEGVCCVMNIMDTECASAYHISCALPERAFVTTMTTTIATTTSTLSYTSYNYDQLDKESDSGN